ncbi:hypothetical protein NLX67_00255 [Domibacillus sp. A3M-37]|uniref:hypothetical protein n=1 Tax=Domibacillus TaxID=1433999 RepID=UPI0020B7C5AB|nr:hypothetical protein [Domibacillus sp. A3M-37]MCP3760825.1 hypothetical protein [Domibacillus sp. A3M-37]
MKLLKEGMRLKEALDDETRAVYARVWKKYADEKDLEKYTLSMLLLCDETGIPPLPAVQTSDDIYEIVIGMAS